MSKRMQTSVVAANKYDATRPGVGWKICEENKLHSVMQESCKKEWKQRAKARNEVKSCEIRKITLGAITFLLLQLLFLTARMTKTICNLA